MYWILAAGKPIVALAPGDCDVTSLGTARGFGVSANPDDAEGFAQCVRELTRDAARVKRMASAAAACAPDFERSRELEKLVRVIEAAANPAGQTR